MMASQLALTLLCVVLAPICWAQTYPYTSTNVTLTSLAPQKLSINVSYIIEGAAVSGTPICEDQATPGGTCPTLTAGRDSLVVDYGLLPGVSANLSDTVQLKACFSNFSIVNRPWRAANNIIAKSKLCPYVIKAGLSPESGTYTWKVNASIPIATYFVRAYVLQNATLQTAYGNSDGYFQVYRVSDVTGSMRVASGICMVVGPIVLAAMLIWDLKLRKKRI